MRFSAAVNVLLLGVATIVSALPIAKSSSSIELESRDDFDAPYMIERDFDEPALYRRAAKIPYHVALHRSGIDTPEEHWRIRFHPQNNGHTKAPWHDVHALSNKEHGGGVLQTHHEEKHHENGYDNTRHNAPGHSHIILGHFESGTKAKEAAKSLRGIKCTEHYPAHNCVDWTKKAVEHLHTAGHIDDAHKATFMTHYDAHQATVRTNTGTPANIAAAGHHK